jgi:hypothetical protein
VPTTRAKVKRALMIPAGITVQDGFIDDIVGGIRQMVLSEVSQAALTTETVSRYVTVEVSSHSLRLPDFPVSSVAAVTDDGTAVSEGTGDDDYTLDGDAGFLHYNDTTNSWTTGYNKVAVTYDRGLAPSAISDIELAATNWACELYNAYPHEGQEQEKIQGYVAKFVSQPIPPRVERALARIRNIMG